MKPFPTLPNASVKQMYGLLSVHGVPHGWWRPRGGGAKCRNNTTCSGFPRPLPLPPVHWDIPCSTSHPLGPHRCLGLLHTRPVTYLLKLSKAQDVRVRKEDSYPMAGPPGRKVATFLCDAGEGFCFPFLAKCSPSLPQWRQMVRKNSSLPCHLPG